MPTTTQPAAGTSLPSTSLTSGLVFARNEADTTASTVLAGSVSIIANPVDGTAYGTDAQGRYKYYNTEGQRWSGVTTGTEYTVLHIVKHVSNGSDQCLSSWDQNPPRRFILKLDTAGKVFADTFRATDTYAGATTKSANTASTSGYSTVVFRVKNDAGTYKAQCFLDGTAASALTLGGTAEGLPNISLAVRSGSGSNMTTDRLYFSAVWNRALTDTEITTDLSNGWAIFDTPAAGSTATITGTTATPAFSGSAQVSPEASITVTTASPTFSGGASTGSAEATITATTESPAFSGSATGDTSQGTLTLPVLKNNTGTILANETGATVHVYAVSTGNKIVTKTGQATNGSGVMTVSDALIVAATQYRVVVVLGSGAEGLDKVTAA